MNMRRVPAIALLLGLTAPGAHAALIAFEGGLDAQAAWRTAVGSYVQEDFDSFAVNTPITQLPGLHLTLDPLAAGGQPGIYIHAADNAPSGPNQIANFPGNSTITSPYQYGDLVVHVETGFDLYAFAFWNGDPQGAAVLRVYDRGGVSLGSVTAASNPYSDPELLSESFAGFSSTVPVGRLEFEGNTGDGWNHYDDFQASFSIPAPLPPAAWLFGTSLLGLMGLLRRRNSRSA